MSAELTIVKYSYIRDLRRTRFPALKARGTAEFVDQLDELNRRHEIVSADQVMAAVLGEDELPPNACWLVFENGYADHYDHVVPLLDERGWQGSFYAPARPVIERDVLDVNKVHFVIAATSQPGRLVEEVREFCEAHRGAGPPLLPFQAYWDTFGHANRFDDADVIFVKRMLQKGLPQPLRSACATHLFERHVTADTAAFAEELYLDREQLRMMHRHGMHLGSHGYGHFWLDTLDASEQAADIDASLRFLGDLGVDISRWTMCYPQGAYDDVTLDILRQRRCTVGFTNEPGPAVAPFTSPLELPTFDTNDLPR